MIAKNKEQKGRRKKQAAEDKSSSISRAWVGDSNTWLGLKSARQEDEAEDADADATGADSIGGTAKGATSADVLPWEEGLDSCPICREDFNKFWDEDGACTHVLHTASLQHTTHLPFLKLEGHCCYWAQLRTGRAIGCCVG